MLQDASKSSTEPEELELASNYPCRGTVDYVNLKFIEPAARPE